MSAPGQPSSLCRRVLLSSRKSVLRTPDSLTTRQYLYGVCPTPDRPTLDGMSDDVFQRHFNQASAKFIAHLSQAAKRASGGYNAPGLKTELTQAKADIKAQRIRAEGLVEELSVGKKEIELLTLENSKLNKQELEQVRAAFKKGRAEGIQVGQEEYLHSAEGLKMVDLFRDVTREIVLYSPEFRSAIVESIPFYGRQIIRRIQEWVASGKSVNDFQIHHGLTVAKEHARNIYTKEQNAMQGLSGQEFVAYIESIQSKEPADQGVVAALEMEYEQVLSGSETMADTTEPSAEIASDVPETEEDQENTRTGEDQ